MFSNLLTQVNNNFYKYLCLEKISVGRTGVPGVNTTAKVIITVVSFYLLTLTLKSFPVCFNKFNLN